MDCLDPPYNEEPYADEISKSYEHKDEATIDLLKSIIDEAESLNAPDKDYTTRTDIFVICRNCEFNGKRYDAAIVMWDGANGTKEQFVTGYYIEWVNESVLDEFNRKLRDMHGDNITVKICSEMGWTEDDDDDAEEHEVFYYVSARNGKSDLYATAEEAYEEANDYMYGLDYLD
jgi:hypothetical protein